MVNENKVACVNIVPTITSIYRWENKLEVDDESLMILKTRTDAIDELIQFIRQNHPYSVPEIIFTPVRQSISKSEQNNDYYFLINLDYKRKP